MSVNHERDRPWMFRTYAGHSSAEASNELYRKNLSKGQTGLSVAFDLPTQTGYDPDHVLAAGEVGKVGVPVTSIDDMRTLFNNIPLAEMNTSMTINATAPWLLALYVAVAEEQGASRSALRGTTQNDILKEYLSRGTYAFPPAASIHLTADVIEFCGREVPKWNPVNVCSYHLQEAGATPVQEIAFTLANAICYLDAVRERGVLTPELVGSISFFCNAGIRIVEEACKMRAFTEMWDRICAERYAVENPKLRRFRYGVQVNSLGLTASQPENNVYRILLEMLAVTASKDARARAVQLPAWNEALGLPRPWDQQWSLRAQQVLAYETDLLEYEDIFNGSHVIEAKTAELVAEAGAELDRILELGGSVEALGYMKEQLVASHARRLRSIESGDLKIVGLNDYTSTEASPLVTDSDDHIHKVETGAEHEQIERTAAHRSRRDAGAVTKALDGLKKAAASGGNIMEPSIQAALAGVTTGEWSSALRDVYGDFRAPTGVGSASSLQGAAPEALTKARAEVAEAARSLGGAKIRMLVAKPGLDGHSNGAEQVAVRARDLGMEVVYPGIRSTPDEIARIAADEDVHLVGVSILSGAHLELVPQVLDALKAAGSDAGVIVGGIIPDTDATKLTELGVLDIYTPRDFDLTSNLVKSVKKLVSGL